VAIARFLLLLLHFPPPAVGKEKEKVIMASSDEAPWDPTGWKSFPILQQPDYKDQVLVNQVRRLH